MVVIGVSGGGGAAAVTVFWLEAGILPKISY